MAGAEAQAPGGLRPEPGQALGLFPLQTVLFPGGLLPLKVFEARYLDLIGRCLRSGRPFGVVALQQGAEVGGTAGVKLHDVGVLAQIEEVDAQQAGILLVRCRGLERFRLLEPAQRQADGLWCAPVEELPADEVQVPQPAHAGSVRALEQALQALQERGQSPVTGPLRLDDAGWVANRWCELLPVSLAAKQKLMELDEPGVRLRLVDEFLRSKGVIGS
ncbi:MAG: LON peptidase substrate-binding domain-containing protein [Rubrivivax sp.]